MASASKAIRQKRRIRRNLSLVTRAYREEALNRVKVQTVLLTILARYGGEIEITQEGLDSTVKSLGQVQYRVEPKREDDNGVPVTPGLFVVRLVATTEQSNEQATAQATVQAFTPEVVEKPTETEPFVVPTEETVAEVVE